MRAMPRTLASLASVTWIALVGCGGATTQSTGPEGPPPPPPPDTGGAAAAPACPMEGGGDAPDTVDGAMMLQPGDNPGCFAVGDKKDTYGLVAPDGQHTLYKLSYEGAPAATGCFEMMDAKKQVARWTDRCAKAPGGTLSAWVVVAPGSQWYLQVWDMSGTAGADARGYRLKVDAVALADADEPNDTPAEAKPLTLGTAKESWFLDALNGPEREIDVFKVDVPKAGTLSVILDAVAPQVQFAVTIHDAGGKKVIEKGAANAGAGHTVDAKVKPGTYTIALRNLAGAGTPPVGKDAPPPYATQPYKITAQVK
jgi:hypothetical protein